MIPQLQDYISSAPILIVSAAALLEIVVLVFFKKLKKFISVISILSLVGAIYFAVKNINVVSLAYSNMLFSGGYASFFEVLFSVIGILTILQNKTVIKFDQHNNTEYQVLILLSIVGMMLMSAGADLITIFIGLELMSVSFYILAGFARNQIKSNEASLKYLLLGAFASGFLLYGIALIYGTTNTTNILLIAQQYPMVYSIPLHVIGIILLMIGFSFKVALVPFHMWLPDVYEGSITNVSGFMASGGKAAAFSAFLLVFSIPLGIRSEEVIQIISVIIALSMVVGNIFGLVQQNIKRMLAYSSIAHAGYIAIGILATNNLGSQGVLFYLVSYSLTSLGAFGVAAVLENEFGKNLNIEEYCGLSTKNPFLAMVMSIFMFSLIGIPPLAGFVGKYYLFAAAVQRDLIWLVVLGVLTSVVSLYYYLRVIVFMYFKEPTNKDEVKLSLGSKISLLFSAIVILVLGIYPTLLISVVKAFFV